MSQYERTQRWRAKNRGAVHANQQRYRQENGQSAYKIARDKRRENLKLQLEQYLSDKHCKNCPENRRPCLCFHHRDPTQKKYQIPQMVDHCYSWQTILTEIEKCDILCHNCHAIIHWT